MNKIKMFNLLKIKIQQLIKSDFNLTLSSDEESNYIIQQQDTPLFRQLSLIRGKETERIEELIFVEAKHNKKRTDQLKKLLCEGFTYNNRKYVRYGKSSSQAKDGITVFIEENFYDEMMERSQLGVKIDKCVISKYESYRNLILSSCQMVDEKIPYIIITDEYEKIISNQYIRYAIQKDVEYVDKNSKEKKVARNQKFIEEGYRDIPISPFDGFGVHTKEISGKFSKYIASKHDSVLFQIRLPFMKGVTVEVDFRSFYREKGIGGIRDIFGKWHNIEDIDCIWNTSMWKGYSVFKNAFGNEAWNEYIKRVNKYGFKIGISKYNHNIEQLNLYSRLNFQYIQCLDLLNPTYLQHFKNNKEKYDILNPKNWGKIINLAKYSTDLMEKIIKGDKLYTLKFLGINDTDDYKVESKYIEAILINDSMLKDPSIKKMLRRKLDKTITQFKYGKIFTKGFYHTVVGDIKGYLEYCVGLPVVGCLNSGEFFAKTLSNGKFLSMRSPLVDPSEVNKIDIVENDFTNKYLKHFKDKDIVMINMYDLTMQQQGGMDEDGDAVFLTNEKILVESKMDKPIVVDMEDKISAKPVEYNTDNIIKYECNSRDSRIGEITNIATSILNEYTDNKKWIKRNEDNVSLLRLYQGKEIDYVKTGFRWVISKSLRRYLKRLPYFLLYNYPKKLKVYNRIKQINKNNKREDRIPYNAFRSPSPMNELCDYICKWERYNVDWDNEDVINNGHLLVDTSLELSNKVYMKQIRKIFNEFDQEFREILDENKNIENILDKYKSKLACIISDVNLLANYCIKTAYRSISSDKVLCWMLFGDIMLKNLKDNSDERKELSIVETDSNDSEGYEFLGKYYKLIKLTEE